MGQCKYTGTVTVLSGKSITGGYAGIDRRPCINSEGGYSAPEKAIEFMAKTDWVLNDGISGAV